jgi:beta-lactamase regulating signal transducer with metallopeptidase domain
VDVLANWIWQGCAVALTATIMMRVLPRTSATLRYRVWWVTLAVVLALPWIPGLVPHSDAVSAPVAMTTATPTAIVLPNLPSWVVATLVAAWIAWVARSLSLVATALVSLAQVKRSARPFPDAREGRLRLWTSVKSSGRAATLLVSDDVRSAAVLGLGRPAIAVAPGVLQGLDDRELDQVLVHEWAHVQRHDDIGRLSQVLVKAIAGLHPAVWWIDRQIDLERESACDDWSLNVIGSSKRYAACLIRLATLQNGHTDGLLMPAAWSPSTLTTRIVRVLDGRRSRSTRRRLPSLAFMTSLLAVTALIATGFELVVKPELGVKPELVVKPRSASDLQSPLRFNPPTPELVRNSSDVMSLTVSARPATATERQSQASPNRGRVTPSAQPVATKGVPPGTPTNPPEHPLETASTISVVPAELNALPGVYAPVTGLPPDATVHAPLPTQNVTPWRAAADAGTSVGRGSQKAAVATAGFFSRLGKSIAGAF